MKISIWDILTGLTLLGVLCLIGGFGAIMLNPSVSFNPFGPPTIVAPIEIPKATPRPTDTPGLPPTWTPTPSDGSSSSTDGLPTLRPSSTPMPTLTRVVLPTFTPSKTVRVGGGTTGGTSNNSGGQCNIIYQNPEDNSQLGPNYGFQMRWTIKNTSSSTWRSDSTDLKFVGGTRMHTGSDIRDLPYDVASGAAVDIIVPMTTYGSTGSYESDWSLSMGGTSVCRFFVKIEVK